MGEKAHFPEQNGISKSDNDPADNEDMLSENEEENEEDGDDLDDISPEEFQMLDNQLDALNNALDDIEQKNDDIHAQLLLLLQSNREIRAQMQESKDEGTPSQN